MSSARLAVCASHSPLIDRTPQAESGNIFRAALRRARESVAAFDPDLVVIFGTDHRRAFVDTVPTFSVVLGATGYGDYGTPEGPYLTERDTAARVATSLLARGFDVAVTRDCRLDHGFARTLTDLLGGIDRCPTVPIFINCAAPPLPPLTRAHALGREIGGVLASDDRKIVFIASGGLSHAPPSLQQPGPMTNDAERALANERGRQRAAAAIDERWDREFMRCLAESDDRWISRFDQAAIEAGGVGANEIRTWVAARGAVERPIVELGYEAVPAWITGMAVATSEPYETAPRE